MPVLLVSLEIGLLDQARAVSAERVDVAREAFLRGLEVAVAIEEQIDGPRRLPFRANFTARDRRPRPPERDLRPPSVIRERYRRLAFPPIHRRLGIDQNVRGISFYPFAATQGD
jgi:hypothetical protein